MSDDQPTRMIRSTSTQAPSDATRVLGGGHTSTGPIVGSGPETRVLSTGVDEGAPANASGVYELTAGWLVVISGPGRGTSVDILFGMNSVGRNPDQRICLNFGDESISRENHAFIVYDEMQHDFYVQHGGKANLVRLNGKPVLAPSELSHGDIIEIGSTKLMFVPLCSEAFNWSDMGDK